LRGDGGAVGVGATQQRLARDDEALDLRRARGELHG
jgi:hypothetical protein